MFSIVKYHFLTTNKYQKPLTEYNKYFMYLFGVCQEKTQII